MSARCRVSTFYLDGYRRFIGENGELLIGGGLAVGNLKIDSPIVDPVHRFNGIGASVAGEGFSFLRFAKTDIGVTGRAGWPCSDRSKTISPTARRCSWTNSA